MTPTEKLNASIPRGGWCLFHYPREFVTLPDYTAHAGKPVRVVRELTADEAEPGGPDMEQMFRVQAQDGWIGDAWAGELEPIPQSEPDSESHPEN